MSLQIGTPLTLPTPKMPSDPYIPQNATWNGMTLTNVPVPGMPDRTVVSGGPLGYDIAFNDLNTAQLYVANNSPVPVSTTTNVATNPASTSATTTTTTGTPTSVNVLTGALQNITPMEIGVGVAALAILYFLFSGRR